MRMARRRKRPWTFVPAMAFLSTGLITICGAMFYSPSHAAAGQADGPVGLQIMPGAVAKRAIMAPSSNATRTRGTVGRNALQLQIADGPTHYDSAWTEELDLDGDGTAEEANLVWDDEHKVLYAFSTGNFRCQSGGPATADLLVAANGAGNPRHRPVGSGFWVADFGQGICGMESAGLWGCRFDESGEATECGAAKIDSKADDLIILK
jgi:hypothetical protein